MAPGTKIPYVEHAPTQPAARPCAGLGRGRRVGHVIADSYGHVGEAAQGPRPPSRSRMLPPEAIAEGVDIFSSGDDEVASHVDGHPATDCSSSRAPEGDRGRWHHPGGSAQRLPLRDRLGNARDGRGAGRDSVIRPRPGSLPSTAAAVAPTPGLFSKPTSKGVVPKKLAQRFGGHGRVVPRTSRWTATRTRGCSRAKCSPYPIKKYGESASAARPLSSPLFAGYMALADQKARLPHRLPRYPPSATSAGIDPGHQAAGSTVSVLRRDYNNGVDAKDGTWVALRTGDDVAAREEGLRRRNQARSAPWRSPAEGIRHPLAEVGELRLSRATGDRRVRIASPGPVTHIIGPRPPPRCRRSRDARARGTRSRGPPTRAADLREQLLDGLPVGGVVDVAGNVEVAGAEIRQGERLVSAGRSA